MKFSRGIVLCAALMMASPVLAQQGGGNRGGFGRGGFGGGVGMIVAIPEVQKELEITDEQKAELRKVGESAREGFGGGEGRRNFQEMSDEERAKLRQEMQARIEKTEGEYKAVLNEKQWARLSELRIQREGLAALNRPDVAAKLGLSDEQKTKIREAQGSLRGQGFGGGRPGASDEDRQKAREEARAAREKAESETLAVLTADQKATWEKMQGEKFEFPRFQGGPGGQGGGQRGGQRRNNN